MKKQKPPKHWKSLSQADKNFIKDQEKMNRTAMELFPDNVSVEKTLKKMFAFAGKQGLNTTVADFLGKKKVAKINKDVEKEFK